MEFEWGPRKAKENLRKHDIDFVDAIIALEDENALTIEDPGYDELQFKSPGMGPTLDILFVVHCDNLQIAFELFLPEKQIRKKQNFTSRV
jgi:uncharacterized DUF497 family protein